MAAEAAALTTSWKVGRRYEVTLTVPNPRRGEVGCAVVEWAPDVPRRLSGSELRQYRRGRDAAMAELVARAGRSILLVDL